MIRVDSRIGSRDLVDYMPTGAAQLVTLPYGDAEFPMPSDPGRLVGFEIKTIPDLMACISSGRFGGRQLPGMQARYNVNYLLIEGTMRVDDSGALTTPRRLPGGKYTWRPLNLAGRHYMYRDLEAWITTMELLGGMRVRVVRDRAESAALILAKWLWAGKRGSEHHAHLVFDETLSPAPIVRPSLVRLWAKELPGIGWERSAGAECEFKTPLELATADESRWLAVGGGIGEGTARKVVAAIRGCEPMLIRAARAGSRSGGVE